MKLKHIKPRETYVLKFVVNTGNTISGMVLPAKTIYYLAPTSSTSKTNMASGGITPPAPALPYAKSDGITNRALSPTCNNCRPSSQPEIT